MSAAPGLPGVPSPADLARHYQYFRVSARLLLSGHSHQAWPDVARAGQLEAFDDAARLVDDKWQRAFVQADTVRAGFRALLGDGDGHIALAASTHDAVVRFLSALPLRERPHLVTSDEEFHTLRRQLRRLAEEGVRLDSVPATPTETLAERLAAKVGDGTAAVLVSTVSFMSARIVPHLPALHEACERVGARLLLDAYHHLNVVPFSLAGLERAFVTGGGYKYCQLGEGNCFLRFPRDSGLRPIVTGWYAEFGALAAPPGGGVGYAEGPERFAGATYDPVSHYRAAAVLRFFSDQGLDVATLRRVSQAQTARIRAAVAALASPLLRLGDAPPEGRAGFVPIVSPRAAELVAALRERGVMSDSRGQVLRLGPAPYLTDGQIDQAMAQLGEVVASMT